MTYIWPSDSFSDCYGQEKAFWEEVSQWQFWTRVEQRQRQEMSWLCVWQRGGVHSNIQRTETLEWDQVNRVSEQSWVLHYRTTTPRLNKLERLRQWCIVMTKATNNITVSQVQNFCFVFWDTPLLSVWLWRPKLKNQIWLQEETDAPIRFCMKGAGFIPIYFFLT